jgi:hypothetical protein
MATTMGKNKFDMFFARLSEKNRNIAYNMNNFLGKTEKTLNEKNSVNTGIIAFVCIISIVMMLFLNFNTPFAIDDYYYNFVFTADNGQTLDITNNRVSDISDIITSMKAHYEVINGRIFIHTIVQLLMIFGKPTFNILNSLVFAAALLLSYKHCKGKMKQNNAVVFIAIGLAWWCFIPRFGQTVLWMDGSVNYLWGTAIRLAVLLPFRLYADDGKENHSNWKIPFMFLLGATAGATNENMGGAFVLISIMFIIYYRIKKFKVPLWSIFCTIGSVIGFALMISAPSNFKRTDDLAKRTDEKIQPFASRLTNLPIRTIMMLMIFIALFTVAAALLYKYGRGKSKIGIGLIYGIGAFAGGCALMFSPSAPDRTFFGVVIAAVISVGNLMIQVKIYPSVFRKIAIICVAFWMIWCSWSYTHTALSSKALMDQYIEREEYIDKQKEEGNYDITVPEIVVEDEDEHIGIYGLKEISDDPDGWPNVGVSKYYGLHSITAYEIDK